MKKYIIGLLAGMAVVMPSCDDLEVDPTGYYSDTVTYASVENLDMTVKYLYSAFHHVADIETGVALTALDDGATDLLKGSWYNVNGGCFNKMFFQDNYITVESNFRSNWSTMYTNIRLINQFLADYDKGLMKLPDAEVKIRLAEAKFIRAFCYMELITRHGGVILRTEEGGVDDHRNNNKARMTTAESWDWVINQFDAVAKVLPAEWTGTNVGRATSGAAYGMKARAALYAQRWDDAIAAANEVIDAPQYDLLPGTTVDQYNLIFTTPGNKELIMPIYFVVGSKQHSWNSVVGPTTDAQIAVKQDAGVGITPTEEYVSQFDIKVGENWEAFDWDNLAKYGNKPFDNREPRFYATVLYNGANWKGRTIELYDGGADATMKYTGLPSEDNIHRSTTGYMIRKFLTTKEYNYTNTLSDQYWTEMRLPEIYFIRSEAYAQKSQWKQAYTDLNKVHTRVGLPELSEKASWEDYLADLQKERICELGLEGHRYNDIIRWNLHQQVLNGQRVHGIDIQKEDDGTFTYTVIECDLEDRKFPVKYSIYPIPYGEVSANPLCEQNDLWK